MYIAAGQRQTTPGDKILLSTETSCHFGDLLQVSKKSLETDFIQFFIHDFIYVYSRDTEKRFFAGSDRFLVCKTDCIKRIFFGPKKTHFADHILAQFPGLVKCQTVNCP